MTWLPIESKMFVSAAYDDARRILYLRFQSGEVYRYFDVPPETHRALLNAESKGRFFLGNIRHSFRYERMAKLRAA